MKNVTISRAFYPDVERGCVIAAHLGKATATGPGTDVVRIGQKIDLKQIRLIKYFFPILKNLSSLFFVSYRLKSGCEVRTHWAKDDVEFRFGGGGDSQGGLGPDEGRSDVQ